MKKILTAVLMVALAATTAAAAQPKAAEQGEAPREGKPPVMREGRPAPRENRGPGAQKERPARPPRGPQGQKNGAPERGPRPDGPNGPRMEGPRGPRDGMNPNMQEGPRAGAPRGPEGRGPAPRHEGRRPMPPRHGEFRHHSDDHFYGGYCGAFAGGNPEGYDGEYFDEPMPPAPDQAQQPQQQFAPIPGPRALGFTVKEERTEEGYFIVDTVTPATAAAYAGVKSGAILYAIDGNSTAQVGVDQMYAYIQMRWAADATAVITFSDGDVQKSMPIKL